MNVTTTWGGPLRSPSVGWAAGASAENGKGIPRRALWRNELEYPKILQKSFTAGPR